MIQIGRDLLARIGCPAAGAGSSSPKAWAALPYLGLVTVTATFGIVLVPVFLTLTVKLVVCASRCLVGNELLIPTGNFGSG
jgi:hypothetical protein